MATSLTSPALVFATDKAIIAARRALAKVSVFATDFSADAVQPGSTMKIPVFTPSAAADFNASSNNYATADGSVTWASVTFGHHVKHTFQFDDKDFTLVNGTNFWANAGRASGNAIAKAILSAVSGLINRTAIPKSAANEAVLAAITKKDAIANLRAQCDTADIDPAETVLMLSPTYFAALLAQLDANLYGGPSAIREGVIDGLYGFKAVIENGALTTATGENLVGALIPTDGLAVAGRTVPVLSPNVYEEIGQTRDEVSGLVIGARRHGDPATGANYLTHEALFGAALVQPTKCVRLVSSATADSQG